MMRSKTARLLALGLLASLLCLAAAILTFVLISERVKAALGAVYESDPEAARLMAEALLSGKTGSGSEAVQALGLTSRFFVYSNQRLSDGLWPLLGIALLPLLGSLLALLRARCRSRGLERRVEEALAGTAAFLPKDREEALLAKTLSAYGTLLEKTQQQETEQRRRVENIAHELKTTAAGLELNLDLAERDGLTPERLARIRDCSQKMKSYIGAMLTLARLQAGKVRFLREKVDLAVLLGTLAEELPGVSFTGDAEAVICGDWERLWEAFHNLAVNALRYGEDDSCRIRLTRREKEIAVELANRGGGLPRLERYVTGREDGSSTGLGTAIAAEIIQAHFGSLSAACSDDETVLTAVFPLDQLKRKEPV